MYIYICLHLFLLLISLLFFYYIFLGKCFMFVFDVWIPDDLLFCCCLRLMEKMGASLLMELLKKLLYSFL